MYSRNIEVNLKTTYTNTPYKATLSGSSSTDCRLHGKNFFGGITVKTVFGEGTPVRADALQLAGIRMDLHSRQEELLRTMLQEKRGTRKYDDARWESHRVGSFIDAIDSIGMGSNQFKRPVWLASAPETTLKPLAEIKVAPAAPQAVWMPKDRKFNWECWVHVGYNTDDIDRRLSLKHWLPSEIAKVSVSGKIGDEAPPYDPNSFESADEIAKWVEGDVDVRVVWRNRQAWRVEDMDQLRNTCRYVFTSEKIQEFLAKEVFHTKSGATTESQLSRASNIYRADISPVSWVLSSIVNGANIEGKPVTLKEPEFQDRYSRYGKLPAFESLD